MPFKDFMRGVAPYRGKYEAIAKCKRGLHSQLKRAPGDFMDNYRHVVKKIVKKKLPLTDKQKAELRPHKQILYESADNKRACRRHMKHHKYGATVTRKVASIVNETLSCPEVDHLAEVVKGEQEERREVAEGQKGQGQGEKKPIQKNNVAGKYKRQLKAAKNGAPAYPEHEFATSCLEEPQDRVANLEGPALPLGWPLGATVHT